MASRDEFRYAKSGDLSIAYATYGEGPPDVVFAHGFAGNIEIERETPFQRAFQDRVASFSRFILFDRRGTGLSDRPREPATLEARMDDVRVVLDAAGSDRAVLFGTVEAAAMCTLFAGDVSRAHSRPDPLQRICQGHLGARLPLGRDRRGTTTGARARGRRLGNVWPRRTDGSRSGRLGGRRSRVHCAVGASRPALGEPQRGCDDLADGVRCRRPRRLGCYPSAHARRARAGDAGGGRVPRDPNPWSTPFRGVRPGLRDLQADRHAAARCGAVRPWARGA